MTHKTDIKPTAFESITIRNIQEGDDLDQIAKLIYLTDPYVYPNWFDSIEDGIEVIREMIDLPTLYNRENVTVAVMPNGFIAGIIVSKQAPFSENIDDIYKAFALAGVQVDERTDVVFQ